MRLHRLAIISIFTAFALASCAPSGTASGRPAQVRTRHSSRRPTISSPTTSNAIRPARHIWAFTTTTSSLEDASKAAIDAEVAGAEAVRQRFAAIEEGRLSPAESARSHSGPCRRLTRSCSTAKVVRSWAKDPDQYSSALGATAYIMIKRAFRAGARSTAGANRAREADAGNSRGGATEPR
jgi:hypothetical protein